MKKSFFLLLVTATYLLQAQVRIGMPFFTIFTDKKHYSKGIIYMEDGTQKDGYVLDFTDPSTITLNAKLMGDTLKADEYQAGLQNKFYYFRENETTKKDEKIPIEDIKGITIQAHDYSENVKSNIIYEKVYLAAVKNDFTTKYDKTPTLLSVYLKTERLTVYALGHEFGVAFYFRNIKNEFAVQPFRELTLIQRINRHNLVENMVASLQLIGDDCVPYLEWLEKFKAKELKRDKKEARNSDVQQQKAFMEIDKQYNKDIKAAKKAYKGNELNDQLALLNIKWNNERADFSYGIFFEEVTTQYLTSCNP